MESENTNENDVTTTVTENPPDMNEFQQAQTVEETQNNTEEISNEVVAAESTVNDNTLETIENSVNEPTSEIIQETTENVENEEVKEEIKNEETVNISQEVNEETTEITKIENTDEATNPIQAQESVHSIHGVEVTNNNPTMEEPDSNTIPTETETTEIHDNENINSTTDNKESMIEEVSVEPPVNTIDNNNFTEIHSDMVEPALETEESPITEITSVPIEQNNINETYVEQNNTIPNDNYSSIKNTSNKQSIVKPVGVENYKFSSEPRAIPAPSQRRKYRDPYELEKMISIQKNEFNQEKQRM